MDWMWNGRPKVVTKKKKGRTKLSTAEILGGEILVRRYSDYPEECVIQKHRIHAHINAIKQYAPEMAPYNVVDSYPAHYAYTSHGHLAHYEAEGRKDIIIADDWQLRTELRYAFTTVRRWDNPPKLDMGLVQAAIDQNNWIFAKTMAYNPHWYALKHEWDDSLLNFGEFVLLIRGRGYTQVYEKAKYRCLNIGDHFYWSMGAPWPVTTLINRKPLPT